MSQFTQHMHVYDQALTFALANLHAFTPRKIEFDVPFTSAPPEPSAASAAATGFAGRETAAFGTSGGHRSGTLWVITSTARKAVTIQEACAMHEARRTCMGPEIAKLERLCPFIVDHCTARLVSEARSCRLA